MPEIISPGFYLEIITKFWSKCLQKKHFSREGKFYFNFYFDKTINGIVLESHESIKGQSGKIRGKHSKPVKQILPDLFRPPFLHKAFHLYRPCEWGGGPILKGAPSCNVKPPAKKARRKADGEPNLRRLDRCAPRPERSLYLPTPEQSCLSTFHRGGG